MRKKQLNQARRPIRVAATKKKVKDREAGQFSHQPGVVTSTVFSDKLS